MSFILLLFLLYLRFLFSSGWNACFRMLMYSFVSHLKIYNVHSLHRSSIECTSLSACVCVYIYKHFKWKDNMHLCMYALSTHELAIKLAIMSNRCQIKTNETNQLISKWMNKKIRIEIIGMVLSSFSTLSSFVYGANWVQKFDLKFRNCFQKSTEKFEYAQMSHWFSWYE